MITTPPANLDLAKAFWNSAAGKAAISEAEQAKVAERAELQKQVAAAQAAHDKTYPTLAKQRAESAAKLRSAEEALEAAKLDLRRAQIACDSAMNTLELTRGNALRKLREELADPTITNFLASIREEIDALRKAGPDRLSGRLWSPNRGSFDTATSNSTAFTARLSALVSILHHADDLHLAADAQKAIAAARKTLPEYLGKWDDPELARQLQAIDSGVPAVVAGVVNAAAEAVGL